MLLYLQFLKLLEARASGLQMQLARSLVDAALVSRAGGRRRELQPADGLVGLRAARAARVGRYHEERFHVCAASYNAWKMRLCQSQLRIIIGF